MHVYHLRSTNSRDDGTYYLREADAVDSLRITYSAHAPTLFSKRVSDTVSFWTVDFGNQQDVYTIKAIDVMERSDHL